MCVCVIDRGAVRPSRLDAAAGDESRLAQLVVVNSTSDTSSLETRHQQTTSSRLSADHLLQLYHTYSHHHDDDDDDDYDYQQVNSVIALSN